MDYIKKSNKGQKTFSWLCRTENKIPEAKRKDDFYLFILYEKGKKR